jgi:hypothetical protein
VGSTSNDQILQYNLSTPYELDSGSYGSVFKDFTGSGSETGVRGFNFSEDGTVIAIAYFNSTRVIK